MKTTFAKLASLALLLTAVAIHAEIPAWAVNQSAPFAVAAAQTPSPPRTDFRFEQVDLQKDQNARIKAVLLVDPNFVIGPEVRPVEVEFVFTDQKGKVVSSQKKMLHPGKAESFELRGLVGPEVRSLKAQLSIRGVIAPEIRNRIVTTLEVTDAKGKTLFVKKNPRLVVGPEI